LLPVPPPDDATDDRKKPLSSGSVWRREGVYDLNRSGSGDEAREEEEEEEGEGREE